MANGIPREALTRLEEAFATGKPVRVGVNVKGTIVTILGEDGREQKLYLDGARSADEVLKTVREAAPRKYTPLDKDSNNTGTVYQTFVPS